MTEKELQEIIEQAIHDEAYGGITMGLSPEKHLVNWQQFLGAVGSNASRRAAKQIAGALNDGK